MSDANVLSAEDLSCGLGGAVILKNVTLRLRRGMITALTGANGSGKTTLLDALSGLVPCTFGSMTFNGRNVEGWPLHKRAAHGMRRVFQVPRVFPRMTVIENVVVAMCDNPGAAMWNAIVRDRWRTFEDAAYQKAFSTLRSFELESYVHEPADVLSFGQRKLVSIAAAFLSVPSVVLLDEPVAGLTVEAMHRVGQLMRFFVDKLDLAVLVVEHNRTFVGRYCSTELVLRNGGLSSE